MQLQVLLKPGEDGWIVAECPALPGCVSQGKTRAEALANIEEAILGWLEAGPLGEDWQLPPSSVELVELEVAA